MKWIDTFPVYTSPVNPEDENTHGPGVWRGFSPTAKLFRTKSMKTELSRILVIRLPNKAGVC
jgi:hypothetical protein